jgi:hypothetical protein
MGSIKRKELRNEGETLNVKIRISKLCFWQTKKGRRRDEGLKLNSKNKNSSKWPPQKRRNQSKNKRLTCDLQRLNGTC